MRFASLDVATPVIDSNIMYLMFGFNTEYYESFTKSSHSMITKW